MFLYESKIFWVLLILIIGYYVAIMIMNQFEWFREHREIAGIGFEMLQIFASFLLCFFGIFLYGYQRGYEDGKTESNKT